MMLVGIRALYYDPAGVGEIDRPDQTRPFNLHSLNRSSELRGANPMSSQKVMLNNPTRVLSPVNRLLNILRDVSRLDEQQGW